MAFSPTGQANTVSSTDITEMNALGYGLASQQTATVIEAFGATELIQAGSNYIMGPVGGGNGAELKYGGVAVVAGSGVMSGWNPIGAEAITGGYEVAWKDGGADLYTVWDTDSNGNYVSDTIGNVAGNSAALEALEPSFHQDLNGDGTIGIPGNVIESYGSTSLVEVGSNFEMHPVSGGSGPMLHYGGSLVTVGEFGGWTPIGAEATGSGYEVAWKSSGQDFYTIWNVDRAGNFLSNGAGTSAGVAGEATTLESFEPSFHQVLNGDGTIGIPGNVIQILRLDELG